MLLFWNKKIAKFVFQAAFSSLLLINFRAPLKNSIDIQAVKSGNTQANANMFSLTRNKTNQLNKKSPPEK